MFQRALCTALVSLLLINDARCQDASAEIDLTTTWNGSGSTVRGSSTGAGVSFVTIHARTEYASNPDGSFREHTPPTISFRFGPPPFQASVRILTTDDRKNLEEMVSTTNKRLDQLLEQQNKSDATVKELHRQLLGRIAALPVELVKDEQAYKLLKSRLTADVDEAFKDKAKR